MRSWLRTPSLLTLALLAVLAISAGAHAQMYGPLTGSVIEPGYAIGPLSLDMSLGDLIWNLGISTVHLSGAGPQFRADVAMEAWAGAQMVALFHAGDNMALALGSADGNTVTRKQVGVGVTQDRVKAAYGDPSAIVQLPARPKTLIYNTLGIAFQIAYDRASGNYTNVESVFVFRPGQAGAVWRMP